MKKIILFGIAGLILCCCNSVKQYNTSENSQTAIRYLPSFSEIPENIAEGFVVDNTVKRHHRIENRVQPFHLHFFQKSEKKTLTEIPSPCAAAPLTVVL